MLKKQKDTSLYKKNGGKKSILVIDDGCGMHKNDLINAFA